MITKFRKKMGEYIYKVISEKKSEHSIALGFAIGTFINILPTPGFNILLCVLIALIFKRINKLSLLSSLVVWNPITLFPIYLLSHHLGNSIRGSAPIVRYNIIIADQIYNFSRRFLLGNFILAVLLSIIFYFIIRIIIKVEKRKILKYLKGGKV